jgi:hypothetical protein
VPKPPAKMSLLPTVAEANSDRGANSVLVVH